MKKEPKPASKRSPRLLLLMPDELRFEIARSAASHGRTVTAEINIRLKESLKPQAPGIAPVPTSYSLDRSSNDASVKQESPDYTLTGIDQAMLTVFRAMPPEKQLALLSLFR